MNNSKIQQNFLSFILYIYFFLVPFEYFLVTSVGTLLRFLGFFIGIYSLFYLFFQRFRFTNAIIYLLFWLFINAISYFWAFSSEYWLLGFSIIFRNSLLLISLGLIRINLKTYNNIIKTYILSGLFLSFFTIFYSIYSFQNIFESRTFIYINGVLFDPNYLVALLIFPLCATLYYFFTKPNFRIFYFFSYLIMLFASIISGSRGGFLTIIVVSILIFLTTSNNKKKSGLYYLIIRLEFTIFFVLFLFIFISQFETNLISRFSLESLLGFSDGGSGRLQIWISSINAFFENPIIGYGSGNVYQANLLFFGKAVGAHNLYLSLIVETGILGFSFFYLFLSYIFFFLIRRNSKLELISFIGLLIVCLFLDSLSAKYLWLYLTFMLLYINNTSISNKNIVVKYYAN